MKEPSSLPAPPPTLRLYQTDSVTAILDYATSHPHGRLLMVAPPAAGKSVIIAAFLRAAVASGLRALVVAHRREIVEQLFRHLIESGLPEEMVGVVMGADKRTRPDAPVQVASVDTLRMRDKPEVDIVVTDEAHRDASNTRRKLRHFYSNTFRLGLTASPCRMDGRGLLDDYDDLYTVASYSQLIADGYIVVPKVFGVPEGMRPNLSRVRTVGGEYVAGRELDRAMMAPGLVGGVVQHWKALAHDLSTVVFAVSIKHSRKLVRAFERAGVTARHIDQGTPPRKRKRYLQEFERGQVMVLCCVNILAEGWDAPRCKCVVMARPTQSLNLHLQQSGRCMRPWQGVEPIILDHAANMMEHDLPYIDRTWELTAERKRGRGRRGAPVRVCTACNAVLHAATVVCTCGAVLPRIDVPAEHQADLVEYGAATARQHDEERIRMFAHKHALPAEWADAVIAAKYATGAAA
jgi:DNA repair protein RadD